MIGFAGTDAKCDWLRELGFDYAFNYKKEDLSETLKKPAPNGVDVYYDNVSRTYSCNNYRTPSINANLDQCQSIPNTSQCGSLRFNADQFPSIPTNPLSSIRKTSKNCYYITSGGSTVASSGSMVSILTGPY